MREAWNGTQVDAALIRMDPQSREQSGDALPRWLARNRYPVTEGATMRSKGRDTTQLVTMGNTNRR